MPKPGHRPLYKQKRNERRHQKLRSLSHRVMERKRKWFYLNEVHPRNHTANVCLDPGYINFAADEDAS